MEYSININYDRKLLRSEIFELIIKFTKENPILVEQILELIKNNRPISCPYPFECNDFPCKNLCCGGNLIVDGAVYEID
jgi:hypothetical protein